jgi:hypothetical protein
MPTEVPRAAALAEAERPDVAVTIVDRVTVGGNGQC